MPEVLTLGPIPVKPWVPPVPALSQLVHRSLIDENDPFVAIIFLGKGRRSEDFLCLLETCRPKKYLVYGRLHCFFCEQDTYHLHVQPSHHLWHLDGFDDWQGISQSEFMSNKPGLGKHRCHGDGQEPNLKAFNTKTLPPKPKESGLKFSRQIGTKLMAINKSWIPKHLYRFYPISICYECSCGFQSHL